MGHCALAGCLLNLALEYLAGRDGVADDDGEECGGAGCNATTGGGTVRGVGGGFEGGGRALGRFAAGGAEFLLLRSHFASWAEAARAGAFQVTLIPCAPHAHRPRCPSQAPFREAVPSLWTQALTSHNPLHPVVPGYHPSTLPHVANVWCFWRPVFSRGQNQVNII